MRMRLAASVDGGASRCLPFASAIRVSGISVSIRCLAIAGLCWSKAQDIIAVLERYLS